MDRKTLYNVVLAGDHLRMLKGKLGIHRYLMFWAIVCLSVTSTLQIVLSCDDLALFDPWFEAHHAFLASEVHQNIQNMQEHLEIDHSLFYNNESHDPHFSLKVAETEIVSHWQFGLVQATLVLNGVVCLTFFLRFVFMYRISWFNFYLLAMMVLLVSCFAQMAALSMRIYMTWYLQSIVSCLGCFFNFVLLVVEFDALIDVYLIRSNVIYLKSHYKRTASDRKQKKEQVSREMKGGVNVAYSYPQKPSFIRSALHSIFSALIRFHQEFSSSREKVE